MQVFPSYIISTLEIGNWWNILNKSAAQEVKGECEQCKQGFHCGFILRWEHDVSVCPSPLGLDRLVFSSRRRLRATSLCVCCGLTRRKRVDIGNRWAAVAESLLLSGHIPPGKTSPQLLPHNVQELHEIKSDAQDRGAAHDVEENLLLFGFGDVTVHSVGTRALTAAVQYGHVKAVVQVVESKQGANLEGDLEDQTDYVGAEETSIDAPFVSVQFPLVFGLPVLPVGHMQGDQQGWGGHHDELQGPEAYL